MNTDVFREYMDLNKYEICRNKSDLLTSFLRDLITKANNEVVGHVKQAYVIAEADDTSSIIRLWL